MKFLVDANLPRRLTYLFRERGHHVVHTLDLPDKNATDDLSLLRYSDENDCVIITKDSDFTTSFWLNQRPKKLFLISTGNINNKQLESLILANFDQIINELSKNQFVELSRDLIIVHA